LESTIEEKILSIQNAFNIIEKLASNEESVAKLYRGYANAYPTLREFWISLASDEIKHASWIRNLSGKTGTSSIFIDKGRFNPIAIQTFTDYLEKQLKGIEHQKIPVIEALSIAFYIEESLIESKYFEIFNTDSAELKNTLTRIHGDTMDHRKRVKEELEKCKNNNGIG
jgi:rubrerythrin